MRHAQLHVTIASLMAVTRLDCCHCLFALQRSFAGLHKDGLLTCHSQARLVVVVAVYVDVIDLNHYNDDDDDDKSAR